MFNYLHGHYYCAECGMPCKVNLRFTDKGQTRFVECTELYCMLRNIMINVNNLETFPHWLYGSNKNYDYETGKSFYIPKTNLASWDNWLSSIRNNMV